MSNIIDSIQLSGVTYTIQGSGGGGNPTVELTQAEYDALVESGAVQTNTYYIITDAQAGDLTQYWTSAQTQSAITEATSGKVDTSAITSSVTSASTDSEIPTAKAVYDAVGGGGKAISAGTNISVTTGETADTINCTLPLSAGSKNYSVVEGQYCTASGNYSHAEGKNTTASTTYSHAAGFKTKTSNSYEFVIGKDNVSNKANTTFGNSGNTLFAIGNGGDYGQNPYHNAFEVRQSGDIYIADTNDTSTSNFYEKPMIKLQDYLTVKLLPITQVDYDALVSGGTVDASTLYLIGDSNGYTMKLGTVNVN